MEWCSPGARQVCLGVVILLLLHGSAVQYAAASNTTAGLESNSESVVVYSNGSISPAQNAGTVEAGSNATDPALYELDNGNLLINVTELWRYFLETGGRLPPLSSQAVDMFASMVNQVDLTGAFSLLQNETFFNSFLNQFADTFPEWSAWIGEVRDARERLLDEGDSGSSSVGMIIGIVLGVLGCVAILASVIVLFMYKRRVGRMTSDEQGVKMVNVAAYDDSLSLKSATTLALSVCPDDQNDMTPDVVGQKDVRRYSSDPVLRWIEGHAVAQHQSPTLSISSGDDHGKNDALPRQDTGSSSVLSDDIPEFLSNLQFHWEDITIVKSLGVGACGKVYLARWNETPVAVKVLLDARELQNHIEASNHPGTSAVTSKALSAASYVATANPRRMLEEIRITAALRHPNVVQFMGFCLDPPSMAAEYCPRGSLYHVLHEPHGPPGMQKKTQLSWLRRVAFAADGAAGMLHLHSRSPQILHRDLNSPNLLVAADWTVKVADMGMSKLMIDSALDGNINSVATSGGGLNPRWLAPEILSGGQCTTASDVFSFGVVMWEILTRRIPWEGKTTWAIVGDVQSGHRPPIPETIVEQDKDGESVREYVSLMEACWSHHPAERPDFGSIAQKLREIQRIILQNT